MSLAPAVAALATAAMWFGYCMAVNDGLMQGQTSQQQNPHVGAVKGNNAFRNNGNGTAFSEQS